VRLARPAWLGSPAVAGTLAVLRLLPRVSRPLTWLLLVATAIASVLPIAVTVATGLLVGSVPAAVAGGTGSPAMGRSLGLLAVAGALVAAIRVLGPLQTALASSFARAVDRHLQERIMVAVGRPGGLAHLEDAATLDLIHSAQGVGGEGLRPGDAVRALASLVPSWFQALGSAVVLIGFSPAIGLTWILLWPLVLAVLQREYVRAGLAGLGQAAALRRADYLRDLALTPPAAKEIRVWGLADFLIERFDAAWLSAMAPVWATRHPGRPVVWLTTGLVTLVNLGAFGLLAWAAIRGDVGLAALAVYSRAALDASAFRAFDDPNAHLASAAVSVPALLDLERRLAEPPPRPRAALPPEAPRAAIRFEGVAFRYPGQPADVVAGLDLTIAAGRSLAIVGANGAGKTTLMKLLCRLYDPTAGRVSVDGVDLRDVDPEEWRRRVAAIFQDFVQYHLPARDNVAPGAGALAPGDGRLRAASELAGALDLVESLPRGWDTVLSRQYAGGVDLSGGQWQKIALARALFAVQSGARVLILDEPTANLDARAEAALYDRFLDITAGLTTILISHRFATVRRADRIVVLADGRVIEDGDHDQLIELGGRYAAMFHLQAARFADDGGAAAARPADRGDRS
jgi:ATP-binding cassette subfamily B protein